MTTFNVTLAAILPAVVLMWFIYRRDPQKEPVYMLVTGFGYGLVAAGIAIVLETAVAALGLSSDEPQGLLPSAMTAFVGAAIPEELAKLVMLWLMLRRNRYFAEEFDGIVYAVCIGMGFAAIENVGYLFMNIDQWKEVAVMRGLFSVPGHFAFAVLMGYFFSLVHIGGRHTTRDCWLVLAVPVLAHGLFDTLLFAGSMGGLFASVLTVLFLLLCAQLVKICRRHIRVLIAFDKMPR